MNTVRFNIKRLGPIRDSVLELSPLMVFSGESGLGKSYAAFLVHYLYILLTTERLNGFFRERNIDYKQILKDKTPGDVILEIPTEELSQWINQDAIVYIGYLLGNNDLDGEIEIELPLDRQSFAFIYGEYPIVTANKTVSSPTIKLDITTHLVHPNGDIDKTSTFSMLTCQAILDTIFDFSNDVASTYLMPQSRGALMAFNLMASNTSPAFSSGMYERAFDDLTNLKRPLIQKPEIDKTILEYLSNINVGDVESKDGLVMYHTNNTTIPITAAASSIKELAPLTLLLKKFPVENMSILFEEPEAHLHPSRQIKVADLIGCIIQKGGHIQITTHSDYFIKRLNNLIMLHQLKAKGSPRYEEISSKWNIKEDCLIDPQNVGAYLFERNNDDTSHIVKQDLAEEGIPFASFYEVIENDIEMSHELRKALND